MHGAVPGPMLWLLLSVVIVVRTAAGGVLRVFWLPTVALTAAGGVLGGHAGRSGGSDSPDAARRHDRGGRLDGARPCEGRGVHCERVSAAVAHRRPVLSGRQCRLLLQQHPASGETVP